MRDFITVIQCPFTELIKRYVYRRFRFGEVCRLFYSFQFLLKIDPSSGKKIECIIIFIIPISFNE